MIKKLYECGCFDYKKFIMDNMKKLGLNSDETIVLITMLDHYLDDSMLTNESLLKYLPFTKEKLEKALASLLERSFYEIYIIYENGIGQEKISVDSFFNKVSILLNGISNNSEDELRLVCKEVQEAVNRILTSKELEIINSLVLEDKYTLENFKKSIETLKGKGRLITIKNIVATLSNKEEINVKPNNTLIKDFFNSIK